MNISVPDDLAEQVRQRELPISAICQRALRDELAKRQAIERAGDIQVVYLTDLSVDSDPSTWIGEFEAFDATKPHLVYGRHPELGNGWTLWYMLGDELDDHFIVGGPDSVEWALRQSRGWLQLVHGERQMAKITVDVGDPSLTVGFTGRWLVEPESDKTRTGEQGYDAGAYWGVALTQRGRIAVYTAHCNDGWPARLDDYDSLDQAADHIPADIIALAARELGEERVVWRDI